MSSLQIANAFVYVKQTVITTIIPFLTTLVLVRFLSPEEFGVFALSQVFAIVLLGIFSLGLLVGYERNYFEHQDEHERHNALFCDVQLISILLFAMAVMATAILLDPVSRLMNIESGSVVIMATLAGHAFDKLSQYFLIYYRNSERALVYSRIMIAQVGLNAVISLIAVIVYQLAATGLALGYAFSWFVIYLFLASRWLREKGWNHNWPLLLEVLKISVPVTPRSLAVIISAQSDKYMLGEFKSIGDVGIYSIASRIGSVVNSFMIALQNVYVPYLFNHMFSETQKNDEEISRYLEKVIYISLFPSIGIMLGAYEIVWVLLPVEYSKAYVVLALFALYYGIIVFGKITSKQLLYAKKTGLVSLLTIVYAILNVLLNIPLIYHFGIVGAVIATLLTGGLATFVGFALAQKYRYLPWNIASIMQVLLVLFTGLGCIVAIEIWSIDYLVSIPLRLTVIGLYLLLGVKSGILNRSMLTRLRQHWRS